MKDVAAPLIVLLSVCVSSCGSARRGEPNGQRFVPPSPAIAQGERVFYEYCHKCHTGGEASLGPAINNKPLPGWLLRTQVRLGLGVMPAFSESEIDERELDHLIAYLIALRRHPSG